MPPFLIIGQARSGTTYVQTLLNSHPNVQCRGELFDAWQIDDDGDKNTDPAAIRARDRDPETFLKQMLSGKGLGWRRPKCIGFKMLTQHHPALLQRILPAHPEMALIYVTRVNKLAQFASDLQVKKTGQWTQTNLGGTPPQIEPAPYWAAAECNRLENEDFLLGQYLGSLPNPQIRLRYAQLHEAATVTSLLSLLGLPDRPLSSPLIKQGQNTVLDRFANADAIREHFEAIGRGDWLGAELAG